MSIEVVGKRVLTAEDQGYSEAKIIGLKKFSYVSASQIKTMLVSMHAYKRNYILGFKPKDTPAKQLGKLIHKALLEPEDFRARYVVDKKFTGTGSRAAKQEWLNNLPVDALLVKQEEADKILFMLESVSNHPEACSLLDGAAKEVHTYVKDELLDQWFYGVFDIVRNSMVCDLKSCASADEDSFIRDVLKYKYYVQAALYSDMHAILGGVKSDHFPIITVENQEPFTTMVYKVPESLVRAGRMLNETMVRKHQSQMKKYFKDPKSVVWAGYNGITGITEPKVSSWQLAKMEATQEAHNG